MLAGVIVQYLAYGAAHCFDSFCVMRCTVLCAFADPLEFFIPEGSGDSGAASDPIVLYDRPQWYPEIFVEKAERLAPI